MTLGTESITAPTECLGHEDDVAAMPDTATVMQLLFDRANLGVGHMDLRSGRHLRVNRKLCEILGYSAEDLHGMTFEQIIHPDDLDAARQANARMLEGKMIDVSAETRYLHKNGTTIWAILNATTIHDSAGQPLYAVAMLQDITERKHAEEALRSSERQFRTLASHAPVGIFHCNIHGSNLFVNDRWCAMTGMTPDEAKGLGWIRPVHPDDCDRVLDDWRKATSLGREFYSEFRYRSRQGKVRWVHGSAVPLKDDAGTIVSYMGTVTDVSDRKRAEWLENDRREVLELVTQDRPLGDVLDRLAHLIDRQTDDARSAVLALDNGNLKLHAPGVPARFKEALSHRLLPLASSLATASWEGEAGYAVTNTTDPVWQDLRTHTDAEGYGSCWTVPIRSNDGGPLGIITIFLRGHRDPTPAEGQVLVMVGRLATISIEHHQTTRQLAHLVRHDPLTGLPNRILLEDRLQQALSAARRNGKMLAVLNFDIDRFKSINDTLGHAAGDSVLQQFAHRLRQELRQSDTLARVGGDEFLLLLPEIESEATTTTVAKKLQAALAAPFNVSGNDLQITSSIGIAIYPRDGQESSVLERYADAAMYRAKQAGRNGYSS